MCVCARTRARVYIYSKLFACLTCVSPTSGYKAMQVCRPPLSTGVLLALCLSPSLCTVLQQPSQDGADNRTALWTFLRLYGQHHADDRPALEHDVAWLTINVSTGFAVEVWAQSHQCWKVCTLDYGYSIVRYGSGRMVLVVFILLHEDHTAGYSIQNRIVWCGWPSPPPRVLVWRCGSSPTSVCTRGFVVVIAQYGTGQEG